MNGGRCWSARPHFLPSLPLLRARVHQIVARCTTASRHGQQRFTQFAGNKRAGLRSTAAAIAIWKCGAQRARVIHVQLYNKSNACRTLLHARYTCTGGAGHHVWRSLGRFGSFEFSCERSLTQVRFNTRPYVQPHSETNAICSVALLLVLATC
jgi:hypothetical protein